jgi:carboxymethylenebutenolidase
MKPGDGPRCPVSFHYGDKDELAPPEELEAVKAIADATRR